MGWAMNYNKTGAVIVAGGLSSRMKEFKPLMKIGDKTIIETTISNFQTLGVDEIVVVIGFNAVNIEKKLESYDIKIVRNKNYLTTHMFDSVCMGFKELNNIVDMTFVTPGDSPFVQQFTLKKMVEEMESSNLDIVQPSYEGKNGHPLLLNKNGIGIMLKHDGDMGMQGAISKTRNYKNINFADPGIILDADNMYDYLKLFEYNEHKNCPSVELCEKIQDYFNMSDNQKRHCNKVAHAALNICSMLSQNGIKLNIEIVVAASMLHDIAKGNSMHAEVGAKWVKDMGYDEIAKIVKEHMELDTISDKLTEKEVVYLADKMVKDDNFVSINERFSNKEKLYNQDEVIIKIVEKRKKQALKLYTMLNSIDSSNVNTKAIR